MDTQEFKRMLDFQGQLGEAEAYLNEVISNPERFPQYDARWLDHRQRELFQAFNAAKDWKGAKRVVEATKDARSKKDRIKRLEELSGIKYDKI